jgi:hypothetical protein
VTPALDRRYRDDLQLELTGLVLVRALLEIRGASPAELAEHDERAAGARAELAGGRGDLARPTGAARREASARRRVPPRCADRVLGVPAP